jgi:aspartate aminotransferase
MEHRISRFLVAAEQSYQRHLGAYLSRSSYERMYRSPGVIDLAFGDPHERPSPRLVELLQRGLEPQSPDWFAYTRDHVPAQRAIADRLAADLRAPFIPDDIALTNGAFAGLVVCLRTICEPGDEILHLTPGWFYYESMISSAGGIPRAVRLAPGEWRLEPERITAAITSRTSALIINTPHNPTGVVYSEGELAALAEVLSEASHRRGQPIYLIADEAYRRIVFDGLSCPSPAEFYPYTLLVHTYTKSLLLPGERIGYIAIPPRMPGRQYMRDALTAARLMTGWAFPNNALQYAVPELEGHTIAVPPLRHRRDILAKGFVDAGFRALPSQGTFYMLVEVPDGDDWGHVFRLEGCGVLALPGSVMGAPGYLRLSLTATDEMVDEASGRVRSLYGDLLRSGVNVHG